MTRSTTPTALALASALVLAGCATGSTEQDTGSAAGTTAPAASAPAGTGTTPATAGPIDAEHDDGDVMFAQMMIPHHEQAVDMSEMLLAKDDVPAEVAEFARQVVDAQGPEVERMHRMLEAWGEQPLADAGNMAGMDHGSGSGMGGMMTPEDLQALEAAAGEDAARSYLEQMTVHHEGAVEMARDQVENGRNAQAVELARQVVEDQEAEITRMEQLLQGLPGGS